MNSKLPVFFRLYRQALALIALAVILYCAGAGIRKVIDRYGGVSGLFAELFTGEEAWGGAEEERAPLKVGEEEEKTLI